MIFKKITKQEQYLPSILVQDSKGNRSPRPSLRTLLYLGMSNDGDPAVDELLK